MPADKSDRNGPDIYTHHAVRFTKQQPDINLADDPDRLDELESEGAAQTFPLTDIWQEDDGWVIRVFIQVENRIVTGEQQSLLNETLNKVIDSAH